MNERWMIVNGKSDYLPDGGFQLVMGVPKQWMVYFSESSDLKWMMTGGTPMLGSPQLAMEIYG